MELQGLELMDAILRSAIITGCALLFGCGSSSAAIDCVQFEKDRIERVDKSNYRLFVVVGENYIENAASVRKIIKDMGVYVQDCTTGWSADWSISFFGSREIAKYKDDEEIVAYVADGRWAAGYLAEYLASTEVLTRFPMLPDKRSDIVVKVNE